MHTDEPEAIQMNAHLSYTLSTVMQFSIDSRSQMSLRHVR